MSEYEKNEKLMYMVSEALTEIKGLRRDFEKSQRQYEALGSDVDDFRTEVHDLRVEVRSLDTRLKTACSAIGVFGLILYWILNKTGTLTRFFQG